MCLLNYGIPKGIKVVYLIPVNFCRYYCQFNSAGMSAYDAVKSWTNKIDLFDMDFIVVPICEK